MKMRYVPFLEIGIFLISVLLILLLPQMAGINIWLKVLFIVVAYLTFVAGKSIIILRDSKLVFVFLNPIDGKYVIDTKDIKAIKSKESYEIVSDQFAENVYPLFQRSYDLDYLDANQKIRTVGFKIYSRRKETEIMSALKSIVK